MYLNASDALLRTAKEMHRPVLLHVMTQKGKGYTHSEEHPKLFHGIGKFDPVSGEPMKSELYTFSNAFGDAVVSLAGRNEALCAITAAMPGGTGLLEFKSMYPKRLFDVGIAEEHAVSMAGGLAKQGMIPVVAIYSTFLQRAYDMILQDICMQRLHVILAVDRAGLVGEDGETHHGVNDVGFLRHAPGLTILCPASTAELKEMLTWAVEEQDGPVAIRYPRGGNLKYQSSEWVNSAEVLRSGALACHRKGNQATIVVYGTLLQNAMDAARILSQSGIETTVLRLMTIAPLPIAQISEQCTEKVFVLEDTAAACSVAQTLAWELSKVRDGVQVSGIDLGHNYVPHGSVEQLHKHYGLDAESVAEFIKEVLQNEK